MMNSTYLGGFLMAHVEKFTQGSVSRPSAKIYFGITSYTKLNWSSNHAMMNSTYLGGFLMAHVEKFTQGSVNGLSIHIERKTTNHSNPDIDSERTYLNYDLCGKEGDMNQRLKNRLAEVYCFNRADVKVMADWIVTLPKSLEQEKMSTQKEFFKSTVDFLNERYGNQNVLSATVHHDETTPHLHYAFIPVVFDEKKQREKVSAKEVLTRKELSSFHQDLDKYLKQQISQTTNSSHLPRGNFKQSNDWH